MNKPRDVYKPTNSITPIEKLILEKDPDIFNGINPEKKNQIIKLFQVSLSETHIGPLPHPKVLAEYNELIENGAERLMTEFENQSKHRRELEAYAIKEQFRQSSYGQMFAFLIGLAALACGVICTINGYPWTGAIIGGGGIIGLVTAFIQGRRFDRKNLQSKKPG